MKRGGSGEWVIFLLILGLAVGVRLYRLGSQGFWVDEFWTMEMSSARGAMNLRLPRNTIMIHPPPLTDLSTAPPWWAIWHEARFDTHPPLYFILVRWWRDLFGDGESAVRSLSLIFSVASVGLLYWAVRLLASPADALISALLLALAAPQIAYAQEARNYSMMEAFALATAVAMLRIKFFGMSFWRWFALCSFIFVTAMTHYFGVGVLLALFIYAALTMRGKVRWQTLLAFVVAGFLFCLLWGPSLIAQKNSILNNYPMYADPAGHFPKTLLRAIGLPLRHLIGADYESRWPVIATCLVMFILGLIEIFFRMRHVLLWWLWLAGSIGMIAMLDLMRTAEQLTMIKYTIAAGPAVCAIGAVGLPQQFKWPRFILPLLLIGLEIYFLPGAYVNWKGDWRAAAETVMAVTPTNDPVVIAGNGTGRPTLSWLYMGMNTYVNPWPRRLAISDREPSPKLLKELQKYSQITLVTDCPTNTPSEILPGFVPTESPRYFSNVGYIWPMARK